MVLYQWCHGPSSVWPSTCDGVRQTSQFFHANVVACNYHFFSHAGLCLLCSRHFPTKSISTLSTTTWGAESNERCQDRSDIQHASGAENQQALYWPSMRIEPDLSVHSARTSAVFFPEPPPSSVTTVASSDLGQLHTTDGHLVNSISIVPENVLEKADIEIKCGDSNWSKRLSRSMHMRTKSAEKLMLPPRGMLSRKRILEKLQSPDKLELKPRQMQQQQPQLRWSPPSPLITVPNDMLEMLQMQPQLSGKMNVTASMGTMEMKERAATSLFPKSLAAVRMLLDQKPSNPSSSSPNSIITSGRSTMPARRAISQPDLPNATTEEIIDDNSDDLYMLEKLELNGGV